jgi:hypothetical protein
MTQLDEYKHLDDDPNNRLRMEMTMPEVVKAVVAQNYGTHRFLSAMVHELRAKEDKEYPSELAPILEDALNRGFFY